MYTMYVLWNITEKRSVTLVEREKKKNHLAEIGELRNLTQLEICRIFCLRIYMVRKPWVENTGIPVTKATWTFFKSYIVSLLWREEGYMVKYSLSTREILRPEPKGFPEGSGYISPYILTSVIIQTFSIIYFQYVLPGRAILEELILCIGLVAGVYFPVLL